jgi:hypothetical protein
MNHESDSAFSSTIQCEQIALRRHLLECLLGDRRPGSLPHRRAQQDGAGVLQLPRMELRDPRRRAPLSRTLPRNPLHRTRPSPFLHPHSELHLLRRLR